MQHVVNEWSTKYIQQSLTDGLSPRLSGCIPDVQYRLLLLLLSIIIFYSHNHSLQQIQKASIS